MKPFRQFFHPAVTVHAIKFRRVEEHFSHFHIVVVTVFAGEIPNILCDASSFPAAIQPEDGRTSAGRFQQAHQGTDSCGLSSTIRADKAENLALANGKTDAINPSMFSIAFCEFV